MNETAKRQIQRVVDVEAAERDRITAILTQRLLGWLRKVDTSSSKEEQTVMFNIAKELQHIIDFIKPRDGCDAAQPAKDRSSA